MAETQENGAPTEWSVSILGIFNAGLRQRRLALVAMVAAVVGAAMYYFFFPKYDSEAIFAPTGTSQASQLAGLAAQFGITATSGSDQSVPFYVQLLTSRDVFLRVAQHEYRFQTDPATGDSLHGDLVHLYQFDGDTPRERLAKALDYLKSNVVVSSNLDAGTITVASTAKWPELAEQITRQLITVVEDFNRTSRQSQAAAQRVFVESRLRVAHDSLTAAENDLRDFYEQNKTYRESPRLTFQESQLERRITIAQGIYTTLAQSLEQSRIEEVRNTPLITVVTKPEQASHPHIKLKILLAVAALLGLILGTGWGLAGEYLSSRRAAEPIESQEFADLRLAVIRDLRRMPLLLLGFIRFRWLHRNLAAIMAWARNWWQATSPS